MSDNREVARKLLLTAGKTILQDRAGLHGSAENSFQMIGDMWSAYIEHLIFVRNGIKARISLQPVDVAQMMVQLKQARSLYGDAANADNFVDAIGYAALAGMLQLPDTTEQRDDTEQMKTLEKDIELEK